MKVVNILLVDDMPRTMKFALARLLANCEPSLKVEFRTTESPEEATRMIERDRPDCIVSDYRMEPNGIQFAYLVSRRYGIPVMIMTADNITPELSKRAKHARVDHIVNKPVPGDLLARWVSRFAREDPQTPQCV